MKELCTKAAYNFADKVLPDSCFLIVFPKLFRTRNLPYTCERLFLYAGYKTL